MSQEWDEQSTHQALLQIQGVVSIGRTRYAASLIWSNADSAGALLAEAREAAERIEVGLVALRKPEAGRVAQYALGDSMLGHQAGMPSLADAVAGQIQGSLYGVWHLGDDLWYLLGVLADGSIVYDKAMTNEGVLRSEFYEGMQASNWGQLICPSEWQVPNSTASDDLAPWLHRTKVRLRPLQVDRKRLLLSGLGVAVVVAGVVLGYPIVQAKLAERAEQARLAEEARQAKLNGVEFRVPDMPWAGKPRLAAALHACIDGLQLHANDAGSLPGWTRDAGQCDGKQVSFSLKRTEDANDNWLAPLVKTLPGTPELRQGSGQATLIWSLPPLSSQVNYAPHSPGIPLELVRRNLTAQFNELRLPISLSDGERQPYWQGLKFSLSLPRDPEFLLPLIGTLPATLLESVSFDADKQSWSVQGQIYERVQPSAADLESNQEK
jgi:hypothetical protein